MPSHTQLTNLRIDEWGGDWGERGRSAGSGSHLSRLLLGNKGPERKVIHPRAPGKLHPMDIGEDCPGSSAGLSVCRTSGRTGFEMVADKARKDGESGYPVWGGHSSFKI